MNKESTNVDAISADLSENVVIQNATLHRKISWTGAFWVASGVPALVLFSMGAISATVGKPAWLVWILSITFGFIQAFTYAEIAGLFPHKSGGASVYGAVAWVRYSKFVAPVSVWCNWFAWSPVLAIGSGLAAGYILSVLFPPDAVINTWQITLLDLSALKSGLQLRINATFIIGAALLLTVFAIQHGGILRSARTTLILGLTGLLPLMLIGVVPLLTGDMVASNFFPLAPLAYDSVGNVVEGQWNIDGWALMAGGLFIAAWSTYGFETAVCYTREFKDPKRDTVRAIFYSGLLCIAVFTLVPLAFQGHLGLGQLVTPAVTDANGNVTTPAVYDGMLAPEIYSGMGVANALAGILGGSAFVTNILVVMLVLALMLSIMTSMAGSSRTLYQGSVDGWLPRYLSHVNEHGAPTSAMWTDLCFNLILLLMSDYVFVLAASNVGYIMFNFLNLNSGWIHRMDRPNWSRPYKAPTILLALGAILGYLNLTFMGLGANIWGSGTLITGLLFASLIIPVFLYRHFIQDKGVFPQAMLDDMHLAGSEAGVSSRAGILPYLTLAAGAFVVYFTHSLVS
ncbi:MAG: APC family permease [Hyphomicrobium zavarzinii]|jgi:amino acid transporter|uniref:APC family permease n=1 Tax=Hyphomicrobium zavarzinii TaxID=48292 RepID=UPI0003716548|nr:APC family permease [Hyphomicrobium zavarzinii]MBL8847070.1 APC family permease [Hyphomicrobium zavarzinii]